MDLIIQFVLEDSDTPADLLRRIPFETGGVEAKNFGVSINETGITLTGIGEKALYHLLSAYFHDARPGEGGALVSLIGAPTVAMVAITDEDGSKIGRMPLGVSVLARDLLADEATFCAEWPTLVASICEEAEMPPEPVMADGPQRDMIFKPLVARALPEDETVSFLILGISPKSVMEDLVGASIYETFDPTFLSHEVGRHGGAIEVVGFGTSDGPGVEVRVPVEDPGAAISVLARHIGPAFAGRVFYVAEIRDAEEVFVVREIGEAGALGEARRVRLV